MTASGHTRVKICGLTNAADRDTAIRAGADAVGFITDVPVDTPRELEAETASELVTGVPPFVTSVLVTMPAGADEAVSLQQQVGADAVQIHGSLGPDGVEAVRERLDAPVLVGVDAGESAIDGYASVADALLVDSTDDEGAGGTGETHDWEQTREYRRRFDVPIVLAGGLTPTNVGDAVETVDPFAVDVASGVERAGGQKDHEAVEQFVDAVASSGVVAHGK
jgi:phosphoribosylanthranilate isomerase